MLLCKSLVKWQQENAPNATRIMGQMPLADDDLRRRDSLIASCWSINQDQKDGAYKTFKDIAQRSEQWFCGTGRDRGDCCVIQLDAARVMSQP